MKIAHLIQYFSSKLGYQEYFLAKEQKKIGNKVFVITSDRFFPPPHYSGSVAKMLGKRIIGSGVFNESGVIVYRLPCLFEYSKSSLLFLSGLEKTVRKINPEVIHCHDIFSPSAISVLFIAKKLGIKLVYDTHATDYNTSFSNSIPKKIYKFFYKKFLAPLIKKNSCRIIAVGKAERLFASRILGMDEKNIPVIELGADTNLFKFNFNTRKKIRKIFKVKDNEILGIYAGKITFNKDLHILFKAIVPLFFKNNDLKLLIVGGGDENYIKQLKKILIENNVKDRVLFHPFVENKDLVKYYSAADFGVWPGDSSITTQEGMAVNLPVILPVGSPDLATSEDCLKNNNGLSFKRGDIKGLRRCIEKLIANPKRMKEMGKRSRELIEKEYSWEIITRRFLKVYQECLNRNNKEV